MHIEIPGRRSLRSLFIQSKWAFFGALLGTMLLGSSRLSAAVPSDQLMSPQSRGFISVPDIEQLIANWHETQIGQLVQDESMRPFIEDVKKQIERKISGVKDKLGIEVEDLRYVAGGEIGLALVEVDNGRAAVALTVDTTNRHRELESFLAKLDKELTKRGATKTTDDREGTTFTTYDVPPQKENDIARQTVYFVQENIFCASDSPREANEMYARFKNKSAGLSEVVTYQETLERCEKEAGDLQPDVQWFADPFGYSRAVRSLEPADKKHAGKDYVKILQEQGFDAVQSLGGFVNLSVGSSFELLHRTAVYAPAIPGEPDKYRLAMRMMKFPNQEELVTHDWLPRKLASYRTFSMDLDNAFRFFGTLFDAIAGYEEAFAGVLEGLERDPYGPQVDVQKDFVAHLGDRVVLVTDYELPITPKCERFMIVVELADEQAIAKTVEKFMKSDPNASSTEFERKTIWEIHEAEADLSGMDLDLDDLELLEPTESSSQDDAFGASALSSSAVCVTDGHLFIASHAEFLRRVLSQQMAEGELSTASDFREVETVMNHLLPGPISAKFFVRTDEAYRPIYELLRQGKMPEAETLFGRLLNRLLTPEESEEEGILREQKIDGHQLPEFDMVRRYFGPAGTLVRTDSDGWFIVGATLTKVAPQARASSIQLSSDVSSVR